MAAPECLPGLQGGDGGFLVVPALWGSSGKPEPLPIEP
jgi:hypothetical protein